MTKCFQKGKTIPYKNMSLMVQQSCEMLWYTSKDEMDL